MLFQKSKMKSLITRDELPNLDALFYAIMFCMFISREHLIDTCYFMLNLNGHKFDL